MVRAVAPVNTARANADRIARELNVRAERAESPALSIRELLTRDD
jgi:hypothetical protein